MLPLPQRVAHVPLQMAAQVVTAVGADAGEYGFRAHPAGDAGHLVGDADTEGPAGLLGHLRQVGDGDALVERRDGGEPAHGLPCRARERSARLLGLAAHQSGGVTPAVLPQRGVGHTGAEQVDEDAEVALAGFDGQRNALLAVWCAVLGGMGVDQPAGQPCDLLGGQRRHVRGDAVAVPAAGRAVDVAGQGEHRHLEVAQGFEGLADVAAVEGVQVLQDDEGFAGGLGPGGDEGCLHDRGEGAVGGQVPLER